MASLFLKQGNLAAAWQHAWRSWEASQRSQQSLFYGVAYCALGEVVTELKTVPEPNFSTDPDEYFQKALLAFREIGAERDTAYVLLAHARSLAKRGERMSAVSKFQQAILIFNRLGMTYNTARAAKEQLELV